MCLSMLGQIVYGAVMLVTLGLTLTSMFTPGWNEYGNLTDSQFAGVKDQIPKSMGIFPFACETRKNDSSSGGDGSKDACKEWWDNLKAWQKVVIAAMVLAVLTEIVALIWNLVTFCTCCCKKYIIHPLSIFAGLIAIFLLIALVIYGIEYKDQIKINNFDDQLKNKNSLGYSFYMAIAALVGAIIDIFMGGVAIWFAKRDL